MKDSSQLAELIVQEHQRDKDQKVINLQKIRSTKISVDNPKSTSHWAPPFVTMKLINQQLVVG